ncbi:asparaginyl-tRNA synthetase-like [Mytilus edulis]|uniref:asparaginyl-tRNA synthetase-like n=1 Tax=Mytilus edulis TaxID=6550 RepID=UPI0039EF0D05
MSTFALRGLKRSFLSRSFSFTQYRLIRNTIKDILKCKQSNATVNATGWVKTLQVHKNVTFIKVNDGSSLSSLQVIIPPELNNNEITFGSSVSVEGKMIESPGQGQDYELLAEKISVCGTCNPEEFPFQSRSKIPVEYVRDYLHLRPRTNFFSSLLRLRNATTNAIHKYFQENDFLFIHTPILTSNDCEGGGEVFSVEPHNKDLIPELSDSEEENKTPKLFFRNPANLTVSGQLHLEIITGAISRCYNFGPTFRADMSVDRTHLAEFYMVEAEMAFTKSLEDVLEVIESLVKFTIRELQNTCDDDLQFYYKYVAPKDQQKTVQTALDKAFTRIPYTDAVKILEKKNKKFEFKIRWGEDLKREHERYLVKYNNNIPVFVTDFPATIKPFYARHNDGTQTVSSVDLLVPEVGELVGGTMREERYDVLRNKLQQHELLENLNWYLDLRKFGSVPHGGFGLGFERLLQFILGINNIRDTIPFPRSSKHCKL